MSTSAISSLSIQQKLDVYFGVRHHDLRKLGQDLASGDLASAQQDFAAIQNLGQNGPFPSGNAFWNSNRQQDFEAIGSALQTGDLTAAQQAFERLKSTFNPSDPLPPVSQGATSVSAGGSASSTATSTTNGLNVTA